MRLLLLTVVFGVLQTAWSVEQCIKAKICTDTFVVKAQRAATDQEIYCIAVREKVDCLENRKKQCTPEQESWINNDIATTKDKNPECGSVTPVSMTLTAMLFFSLTIYIFSRQ